MVKGDWMDLGGPRHPPPSVKLQRCPWCKRAKTVLCWQVHYPQEDPTSPSFPRAVKSLLGDTKPDLSSPEELPGKLNQSQAVPAIQGKWPQTENWRTQEFSSVWPEHLLAGSPWAGHASPLGLSILPEAN